MAMQSTSFAIGGNRLFAPAPSSTVGGPSHVAASSRLSSAATGRRGAMPCLRVRCRMTQPAAVDPGLEGTSKTDENAKIQYLKEKIKNAITNVRLSASSFDTAWVAMVPSPTSPSKPCFPKCLDWILRSQNSNGSWTLHEHHTYLIKDALSSTLACILALKRWNVGEDHILNGIEFIRRHSSFAIDNSQYSPIGFNIIFSGMIQYGKQLGLDIPISEAALTTLLAMRDMELKRENNAGEWNAYLAYVIEGLDLNQDYEELKKYQNENGSLFNSPSATAAMLIRVHDTNALEYLQSVVQKFGNAVPAVYPSDIYARLCMADSLEKLGIGHHFNDYIESVLDEAYRAWLRNDEELCTDMSTCALAFRLLRMHGYAISSDIFDDMNVDNMLSYKLNSYPHNVSTALELYKASQMEIYEDEIALKELYNLSCHFLRDSLSNFEAFNDLESCIMQEVDYNLKTKFVNNLNRLEHRRNIETFKADNVQCLKTSFRFHNVDGEDLIKLAVYDFNYSLSVYQMEFQHYQRWARELKLDKMLRVDLIRLSYSFFTAAATITSPELSDARMSWAKNSLLVTVIDDIFDVFGSREERHNFLDLLRRWDPNYKQNSCSEQVYTAFHALYTTIEEFGAKGSIIHGYPVISHMIESWVEMVDSFNIEAEWRTNRMIPTMDDYMANGYLAAALGPMMIVGTYFVGPKLSWHIIRSPEYHQIYFEAGVVGRLTNDTQSGHREVKEYKSNSVSIKMHEGLKEEDAKREVWRICDASKNKLFGLVTRRHGSVVPRPCKDVFWNMCRILYFFYNENDGYRRTEMATAVNLVIHEPISICNLSSLDRVKVTPTKLLN